MSNSVILNTRRVVKYLIIAVLFSNMSNAMMRFMPKEQLVATSKYIVIAKMQDISDTGKTAQWRDTKATIIKNELKVMESIKGSWALEKPLIFYTFKFDGWMEDNVELPTKGSKVLLFLKKNEKGELKPVNGIQGVWPMLDGQPTGAGSGTTLEQIREMVQKQVNKIQDNCKSEAFTSLVDTAEIQSEAGKHKEALEAYRKAYRICPMRDLEEQMAWLMGEVGDEDGNNNKDGRL